MKFFVWLELRVIRVVFIYRVILVRFEGYIKVFEIFWNLECGGI